MAGFPSDVVAIHLGRMSPPASCNPPGRLIWKSIVSPFGLTRRPYSVLLPVGFTVPPMLPLARWALTPPFHPYPVIPVLVRCIADMRIARIRKTGRFVFCGTFPGVAPAGRYPAPYFPGARTFLTCRLSALDKRGYPTD